LNYTFFKYKNFIFNKNLFIYIFNFIIKLFMPQFDAFSFSGQVFCILLGFSFFYFFILRIYLINFAEMFKFRQKLLNKYFLTSSDNSLQSFHTLDFFLSTKI